MLYKEYKLELLLLLSLLLLLLLVLLLLLLLLVNLGVYIKRLRLQGCLGLRLESLVA